jgi:hypothetical protein
MAMMITIRNESAEASAPFSRSKREGAVGLRCPVARLSRAKRQRLGAILSFELVLVLPIAIALVVALVEFGLLWNGAHKVHLATEVACRVGTRPCEDLLVLDNAVRQAAETALVDKRLAANHRLTFVAGAHTGDPVSVEIRVPMTAASPDMLAVFGFSLQKRYFDTRVVMSKE